MLQSVDVSWPQNNYLPGSESGVFVAATSGDGGTLFTQSTFAEDVANARAAGKEVGFYHFNGPQDAAASADYFWAVIAPYYKPGDAVGLDIESYNSGTAPAQTPAWASAFLAHLAQLMRAALFAEFVLHALVYGNRSDMSRAGWGALEQAGHRLWLAAPGGYPENTPIGEWSHWTILQYSSDGGIDRDESESTFAQIAGTTPAVVKRKEVDMLYIASPGRGGGVVGPTGFYGPLNMASEEAQTALATYGAPAAAFSDRQFDVARQTAINIGDQFAAAVAVKLSNLDAKTVAAAVVAALPAQPGVLTQDQVTAAVAKALQGLTLKAQ